LQRSLPRQHRGPPVRPVRASLTGGPVREAQSESLQSGPPSPPASFLGSPAGPSPSFSLRHLSRLAFSLASLSHSPHHPPAIALAGRWRTSTREPVQVETYSSRVQSRTRTSTVENCAVLDHKGREPVQSQYTPRLWQVENQYTPCEWKPEVDNPRCRPAPAPATWHPPAPPPTPAHTGRSGVRSRSARQLHARYFACVPATTGSRRLHVFVYI
jgi:hypothetical protein